MSEKLELAFVDKLYPQEVMPLAEVQKEATGSLFWVNSRGLERVFAYQGGADFIGLEVNFDVKSQKASVRFSNGVYVGDSPNRVANDIAPIAKVDALPETVDFTDRNEQLMIALMESNVDFWDEFIDWCQGGLVKKVFSNTESYADKMNLGIQESDMFTKALQGLEDGSLEYKDQVIWLN